MRSLLISPLLCWMLDAAATDPHRFAPDSISVPFLYSVASVTLPDEEGEGAEGGELVDRSSLSDSHRRLLWSVALLGTMAGGVGIGLGTPLLCRTLQGQGYRRWRSRRSGFAHGFRARLASGYSDHADHADHDEATETVTLVPSPFRGVDPVLEDQHIAETLRATLAKQQGVLSAIPELIYMLSADGTILERVSPDPKIDFVDLGRTDITGCNVKQFGYAREKLQCIQAALATGQVQRFEQCIRHGSILRYEEVRIAPLNDHQLLYLVRDISDLKRTEQALREAHNRQSAILNTIPDLMFVVGADGLILERVTERPEMDLFVNDDIIGRFITDIHNVPERVEAQLAAIAAALATGQVQVYEQWIVESPSLRCEEVRCAPIDDNRCLLMFRDISDRKQAELALQASEARRRLALELSQTGSWEFDIQTGEANWSDSHYRLMGLTPGELPSQYLTWRDRVHPEDIEATEAAFKAALENHAPLEVEYRVIHPDGSIHWVLTRGRGIYADDGTPSKMTGVMFDVSDRKRAELELQRLHAHLQVQATVDSLTQVANRRQFETVLAQAWPQHQRQRQPLALMMVDIDHFKAYNDYYGHPTGDRCLQQVANLLDHCVRRGSDLVARYGGEEFIILLPNTDEEGAITLAQLMQTQMAAQAIAHAASTTVPYVTLSIGIAVVIPPCLASPTSAIAAADRALYQAKQIRNCYRLHRLHAPESSSESPQSYRR